MGVSQLTLVARAVDHGGNTADSPPVVLDVLPDDPPKVEIVTPRDGGGVIEGATVEVQVEARDDVSVARVDFLANGVVFATITDEPFFAPFVVPQLPAGQNNILVQVRAVDPAGHIGLATVNLDVFQTPIMTNRSIVVGPNDFSTNDSNVLGEFRAVPVRVYDNLGQTERFRFFPYGSNFAGGVRVATGDVNRDGAPDIITGAGPGAPGGHIKVFSGQTGAEIRSFFAFPGFTGGVFVAGGDVNADGFDDIVVGADAGGHVKVFSGDTSAELSSFFAFPGFMGGVRVAAGDVNGDGRADIITGAGPSANTGPLVKVFNGLNSAQLASFFAYDAAFPGGVFVGAADFNRDGRTDIVTGPGLGIAPQVRVFDGVTQAQIDSFFAYDPAFLGGVRVGSGDLQSPDHIVGPGAGLGAQVRALDGQNVATELANFTAYDQSFTAGVFVAGSVRSLASPSDVTARLKNGNLRVTGDKLANHILIEQVGNRRYRLTGLHGTRINGQTGSETFNGVRGVRLFLLAGDDTVQIGSLGNPTSLPPTDVDLGRGADTLVLSNVVRNQPIDVIHTAGQDKVRLIDEVLQNPCVANHLLRGKPKKALNHCLQVFVTPHIIIETR
jgi:hypothetical protein